MASLLEGMITDVQLQRLNARCFGLFVRFSAHDKEEMFIMCIMSQSIPSVIAVVKPGFH